MANREFVGLCPAHRRRYHVLDASGRQPLELDADLATKARVKPAKGVAGLRTCCSFGSTQPIWQPKFPPATVSLSFIAEYEPTRKLPRQGTD
jgi:hypothetical protein